jgi:hypothetical protein
MELLPELVGLTTLANVEASGYSKDQIETFTSVRDLSVSMGVSTLDGYWGTPMRISDKVSIAQYGFENVNWCFPYTAFVCCPRVLFWEPTIEKDVLTMLPNGENFLSETFYHPGVTLDTVHRYRMTWINSPVTRLHPDVNWISTLKAKRRYEVKTALKDFSQPIVTDGLTEKQKALVIEWLAKRWGTEDDATEFAVLQFLYAIASGQVPKFVITPNESAIAWFLRVQHEVTPQRWVFGGLAYDCLTPRLGTAMMASFANYLQETVGDAILDPTCRTSFNEESIDVYKRHVINQDNVCPMLSVITTLDKEFSPPYFYRGVWKVQDSFEIMGDPV